MISMDNAEYQKNINDSFKELLTISYDFYKRMDVNCEFLEDDKLKISNNYGESRISLGVVKVVWNFSYIYDLLYVSLIANTKAKTRSVNPNRQRGVFGMIERRRKQIRRYFKTAKENTSGKGLPEMPPDSIDNGVHPRRQPYIDGKSYWVTSRICSYALFYLLLHEYSHTVCPFAGSKDNAGVWGGDEEKSPEEIENDKKIEYWCDENAFKLFDKEILKKESNRYLVYDKRQISIKENIIEKKCIFPLFYSCTQLKNENATYAKIGIQVAMMFLVEQSLDQMSFESNNHPEAYLRIKNIMEPISKDDDEFWSFLVAAMSYEFSKIKEFRIDQSKVHRDFKSVVREFLHYIEEFDKNQCRISHKTSSSFLDQKVKIVYGYDFGVGWNIRYEWVLDIHYLFENNLIYGDDYFILVKNRPAFAFYYGESFATYKYDDVRRRLIKYS